MRPINSLCCCYKKTREYFLKFLLLYERTSQIPSIVGNSANRMDPFYQATILAPNWFNFLHTRKTYRPKSRQYADFLSLRLSQDAVGLLDNDPQRGLTYLRRSGKDTWQDPPEVHLQSRRALQGDCVYPHCFLLCLQNQNNNAKFVERSWSHRWYLNHLPRVAFYNLSSSRYIRNCRIWSSTFRFILFLPEVGNELRQVPVLPQDLIAVTVIALVIVFLREGGL